MKNQFTPKLLGYCQQIESEFDQINPERKHLLMDFSMYLMKKKILNEIVKLVYICSHNSRRSHFGQIWMQTATLYYEISGIETFSGGTEATEFNKKAVAALIRAGLLVENYGVSKDANPKYYIRQGEFFQSYAMFSKVYDHQFNPQENFCAIMVCTNADENCPFIPGAEKRISLPYNDPKDFDGTDQESEIYDEKCSQIAREMFFVINNVKVNMNLKN